MRRRTKLTLGVAGLITVLLTAGLYARSSSSPAAAAPVVIVAAGDIACDPAYPDFNTGTGTAVGCHEKATSDLVETIQPKAVLALGDIQYVHGTAANYAASYGPTWGRFKDITHPVLGNHEGGEGGTNTTYFDYFGQSAGDRTQGYYSFDLGAWHLIALNSNCGNYSFNHSHDECTAGSAQDTWLKNDLATHPAMCTLAYFHVPRFSSGTDHHSDATSDNTLTTLWDDLYSAGADVILNGHAHEYERFAPLDPRRADRPGTRHPRVHRRNRRGRSSHRRGRGTRQRSAEQRLLRGAPPYPAVLVLRLRNLSTTAPRARPTSTTAQRNVTISQSSRRICWKRLTTSLHLVDNIPLVRRRSTSVRVQRIEIRSFPDGVAHWSALSTDVPSPHSLNDVISCQLCPDVTMSRMSCDHRCRSRSRWGCSAPTAAVSCAWAKPGEMANDPATLELPATSMCGCAGAYWCQPSGCSGHDDQPGNTLKSK